MSNLANQTEDNRSIQISTTIERWRANPSESVGSCISDVYGEQAQEIYNEWMDAKSLFIQTIESLIEKAGGPDNMKIYQTADLISQGKNAVGDPMEGKWYDFFVLIDTRDKEIEKID